MMHGLLPPRPGHEVGAGFYQPLTTVRYLHDLEPRLSHFKMVA